MAVLLRKESAPSCRRLLDISHGEVSKKLIENKQGINGREGVDALPLSFIISISASSPAFIT